MRRVLARLVPVPMLGMFVLFLALLFFMYSPIKKE